MMPLGLPFLASTESRESPAVTANAEAAVAKARTGNVHFTPVSIAAAGPIQPQDIVVSIDRNLAHAPRQLNPGIAVRAPGNQSRRE